MRIGVLAPAVILLLFALMGGPRTGVSLTEQRQAFAAYEKAVDRAVQDGGFIVTQGMKPGLADISGGRLPDDRLEAMAKGWTGSMQRVRRQLASVEPPAFLREAGGLYDAALAAYVKVGEALVAAAQARGEERAALIAEVPPLGERADELWNRAAASLERERKRLGLGAEEESGAGGPEAGR